MEKLLFLLFSLIAFSSINSEGNDKHITSTALPASASSSLAPTDLIQVITGNQTSSNLSSQLELITTQTSEIVSSTTASLSSRHTGTTDGSNLSLSSTSGQSIITTSLTLMTSESTDTTPNATSSPGTKITVGVSVHPSVDLNISLSAGTAAPTRAPDSSLTLLAFGVMSLILILIVVMVILVTTINLRGKCKAAKQHEGLKSCESVISDSNMTSNGDKESITLVSVRTINTDNDTDSPQISSVRSTIVDNEDQEFTRDLMGFKDGL